MKTYLKDLTPEEVIRRLKAGEVVKSNTYEDFECKLIDGFIMSHNPDGYFLNPGIFISGEDLYFETPDELELEVGKCYRTRDGRKAFVSHYDDNVERFYGVILLYTPKDTWQGWFKNGHTSFNDKEHDLDLVAEWSDDDVAED